MSIHTLYKKIWPFVRPYRTLMVATLTLTLVSSLTMQVNAVVLDRTVDAINALLHAPCFEWRHAAYILVVISAILLGKELLAAVVTFGQKYFGEKMRIFISKDLAQAIVDKVLTYQMSFFSANDNEPARLQTRIDRGVESLTRTVQNFFIDILPLFSSAILALILMFAANVYVGLVASVIVPVYFFITFKQAAQLKGRRRCIKTFRESKSHGILTILESVSVIKSFNREEIEGRKQFGLQVQLTNTQMDTRRIAFFYDGLKTFVEQIGTVLVIILTAYLVLTDYPGMTIGKIMYHVMLFSNVSAPIRQLHRIYDEMNDALIYGEGYFSILDASDQTERSGSYRPEHVEGNFSLQDVSFAYPNGTKALHNINMQIRKGAITAFVGLSGAGKSTIVNLLVKFYDPSSGRILLDGVDLRNYDTSFLRENIGLVLQKNHIFDGSVIENIRYGKPSATDEEVFEAARKAYLFDQISALPQGFLTSATKLSGGQQQRVAIARVFLKNPPIIFLDEPTASLDAVATEQIKNSLDAIKQGRTVVIISHSISQIIDADFVYALSNGRVEQGGTNEEVYRQGGIYKQIFDASARSLNIDKIASTIGGNV